MMNTGKNIAILIGWIALITLVTGQFITIHPKAKDNFAIIQLIALVVFIAALAYIFVVKKNK